MPTPQNTQTQFTIFIRPEVLLGVMLGIAGIGATLAAIFKVSVIFMIVVGIGAAILGGYLALCALGAVLRILFQPVGQALYALFLQPLGHALARVLPPRLIGLARRQGFGFVVALVYVSFGGLFLLWAIGVSIATGLISQWSTVGPGGLNVLGFLFAMTVWTLIALGLWTMWRCALRR